jgi:hypothetical protein
VPHSPKSSLPAPERAIFSAANTKDATVRPWHDEKKGGSSLYRFSAVTSCATSPLRLDRKDVKIPRWR